MATSRLIGRVCRVSALACLFGALPGSALLAGEATARLSAEEIRAKIVGQVLVWSSLEGQLSVSGQIVFDPSGKVVMTTNLPGLPEDIGAWWLDDDRICTRWEQARDGAAKCYRLTEESAGRFISTGGNMFEIGGPMA
jgi:hypothetical protein